MSLHYHIWTIGCQMNEADSRRLAAELRSRGGQATHQPEKADLIILNTCVVRQGAEDKVYKHLSFVEKLKKQRPGLKLGLMGCLVGIKTNTPLQERFPYVDFFLAPSNYEPLLAAIDQDQELAARTEETTHRPSNVSALVPIVLGCSHACAYCVIPSRRGPEKSRLPADILAEIRNLAAEGIIEVTLLGQIVDRYGLDLDANYDLADLLKDVAAIDGLQRIRFLTSHPNWITPKLLETIATEPKICPHLEIAVQSGNNRTLERMRRGYTHEHFRQLVGEIRTVLPQAAINTDIIVGFPGETEEEYAESRQLLADLRLDKVHIAAYSERPTTFAARHYADDVPDEVKQRRAKDLDDLQKEIQRELQAQLLGKTVEVLVEGRDEKKGRWTGRTPQNRLVFFAKEGDLLGKVVPVKIGWTGPFTLIGAEA